MAEDLNPDIPDPKATLQYYDYANSNLVVGLNEVDETNDSLEFQGT